MPTVIDVDFQIRWAVPVHLRIAGGSRKCINGPDAALLALQGQWPSKDSAEFSLAVARCRKALMEHGSAELARQSFVNAAVQAKVLS